MNVDAVINSPEWNQITSEERIRLVLDQIFLEEGFELVSRSDHYSSYRADVWYKIFPWRAQKAFDLLPGLKECTRSEYYRETLVSSRDVKAVLQSKFKDAIDLDNPRESIRKIALEVTCILRSYFMDCDFCFDIYMDKNRDESDRYSFEIERNLLLEAKKEIGISLSNKLIAAFRIFTDFLFDTVAPLFIGRMVELYKCALFLAMRCRNRFASLGSSLGLSEQFSALWDQAHELHVSYSLSLS